ncbi:hypothetical protein ABPG77_009268 [Micractinium sp. CCAP 211/92]
MPAAAAAAPAAAETPSLPSLNVQDSPTGFGILTGEASPLHLQPLDLLGHDAPSAMPLANPVLTPWQLPGVAALGVPTLAPSPHDTREAHMFFAARVCGATGRWGIAVAVSVNGGWTWRPLGWALRDPSADLMGAAAFNHNGTWYLVPETGGRRGVQLYRATRFPTAWELLSVLVEPEQALQGVGLVHHAGHWWLLGSQPSARPGGEDHELVVYRAPSPEGLWTPYGPGSFAAKAATGSPGAAFVWQGVLHRLGRSCRRGACGEVQLVQVALTDGKLQQSSQPLGLIQSPWLQRARWDSAGWAALSLAQRADGTFLAAVEGRQLPHGPPALPRLLATAVAGFRALALLCIAALLLSAAGQLPTLRGLLLQRRWGSLLLAWTAGQPAAGSRAACKADDMPGAGWPGLQPVTKAHLGAPSGQLRGAALMEAGMQLESGDTRRDSMPRSRCGSASSTYRRGAAASAANSSSSAALPPDAFGSGSSAAGRRMAPQPLLARLRALRWRMLLTAVTLVLALLGFWAARVATRIAAPFADPPVAVPVGGQYSRFTLMVMSYDRRLKELQWYVRHYSQCPSVGEVLVVWNRGPPPVPERHLPSAVPVRVRVERANSMNNRFRPDPDLRFRSVLSLDDDILMPCSTVEAAFAAWRTAPQRLLGFYPRLLLPKQPGGPPTYQFEEFVFEKRAYNTILAGAAFMDAHTFFPLYSSDAVAPARALVDQVFNCDDLLLNFVVANWTAHGEGELPAPVQLMRPRRRLDLSRLSGVGISHNQSRFKAAADRCLASFTRLFGSFPLVERPLPTDYGSPPSCHLGFGLDCMYLADH